MDIPRFDQHLNRSASNFGDAFQQFAHELLLYDYPDLHFFQAGGKDGGIDLVQTEDGSRLVVECKYIGKDGVSEALSRWREVEDNLGRNLAGAGGPSEAQYQPWYTPDPAITEYVFCVSSELNNLGQGDRLWQKIAGFFADLSARHPHLAHLSKISVTVLDWNDLTTRLRKRPHLVFRWFKLMRDYGLATLDETADRTTFRSYLYGDKLPYYSRLQHMGVVPPPTGVDITDEEELLGRIAGDTLTGLILTGGGGVGKTRLTLEIGYRAQGSGWTVLRVQRRLKENALEHLARCVTPETKVLLLIDYVETQRDFMELVDALNDLNDSLGLHLRYVANCRTSYYKTIAGLSRHKDINLSPALVEPPVELWFESYLRQTVRHILEHSGIDVGEQHLKVCRDIPVLAVFLSYLHGQGRQPELQSLLAEENFARWIVKRLGLSFPGEPVSKSLAQLVALFPMPSAATRHPDLLPYRALFDGLAADGWVEEFPADEEYKVDTWRAAHDVFADQILLFYFEGIPHTVEGFVRDLLSLARRVGCLRPALTTLQRLIDKPALKALDWPQILGEAIAEDPPAWRGVRDLLVRTPLLTHLQIIDLLGAHEEVWRGAEEEANFQLAVGWLARWVLEHKQTEPDETQRSILGSWLQKAARHATVGNYVLTSGVKFCPELVRESALNWIRARPRVFQTHYLIVAWLEQKLPTEDIAPAVAQWVVRYAYAFHLSFIVRAWLNAGGDKELLRQPIQDWLVEHKSLAQASFVYQAWLDAGGDKELVQGPLTHWLAEHKSLAQAQFVYQAWLDAGGDTGLIQAPLETWLAEYKTAEEASFVYRAWLNAGGDKEPISGPLTAWLAGHNSLAEARFVYKAWLDAGGGTEPIRESLTAWLAVHKAHPQASFIYQAWLDAGGDTGLIQAPLETWLAEYKTAEEASFVYRAWLNAGGGTELVRDSALAWLAEYKALAEARFVYRAWLNAGGGTELIQESLLTWMREHGAGADASFVLGGWLAAGGNKELIRESLIAWLAKHKTEEGAHFIYYAWLEADGPFLDIRSQAIEWLSCHYEEEGAVFLIKHLARQKDIPTETVKNILSWCRKFSANEDVLWRLTQLGRHLLSDNLAEEVYATSAAILHQLLSAGAGLTPLIKGQITTLFAYLIEAPGLLAGSVRDGVDELLIRWLRHPASFGDDPKPHFNIQRRSYVWRVIDLLDSGALDVAADRGAFERFLRWVNEWELTWKLSLRGAISYLERNYPAPGLWDIVKFDGDTPLPSSNVSSDAV